MTQWWIILVDKHLMVKQFVLQRLRGRKTSPVAGESEEEAIPLQANNNLKVTGHPKARSALPNKNLVTGHSVLSGTG